MTPRSEDLTAALEHARRALAILEAQAAGYTVLTIPAHLQLELEEKRREVADLEVRLSGLLLPARPVIRAAHFPYQEPYYTLPSREAELMTILNTLYEARQRATVLVTGLGGIGKTALVVEVARRCAQDAGRPFQAILWESAKQELLVEGERIRVREAVITFADLVDSLGVQLEGPEFVRRPAAEKEVALQAGLAALPALVIVDNLETTANAQEILVRLQRLLGRSRALITSRLVVAGDAWGVRLEGLPEACALTFLRTEGRQRNIPEIAEADDALLRELYQVTQGMPLAMKILVGQAATGELPAALARLRRGQGELYFFLFLETWNRLSDTAKQLLLYLGPTAAPVSREELGLALELTEDTLDAALQELLRFSLLDPLGDPRRRWYTLHQLTRYFVVNDLPAYWETQGWL